jgi:hypothetical protein
MPHLERGVACGGEFEEGAVGQHQQRRLDALRPEGLAERGELREAVAVPDLKQRHSVRAAGGEPGPVSAQVRLNDEDGQVAGQRRGPLTVGPVGASQPTRRRQEDRGVTQIADCRFQISD